MNGATTISGSFRVNTIEDGENGYSTVIVQLFRRSSSALTDSDRPQDTLTYTFSTGVLSGTTAAFNGWTQSIPAPADNTKLYIIMATASSQGTTDTIAASEWSTPVEYVADGLNSATVNIYKRAASIDSTDKPTTSCTYTFASGSLSGTLNGWTTEIPSSTNELPCWVRRATAVGRGTTDTIGTDEWSDASKLVVDGTSPWIADLDNEMDSVACDSNWHPVTSQTITTNISLYYGSTLKKFYTQVSGSETGITVAYNNQDTASASDTVTVTFATTAAMSSKKEFEIFITSEDSTIQRVLYLTVIGIKGTATYRLVPSASSIAKSAGGTYTPSAITCKYVKTDVAKGTSTEGTDNIYWYLNGDSTDKYELSDLEHPIPAPGQGGFTQSITFELDLGSGSTELIADRETVNIIADGANGKDAAVVVFDPSTILVSAKNDGTVNGTQSPTTSISLMVNGSEITSGLTIPVPTTSYSISLSGRTATLLFTDGDAVADGNILFDVTGTLNGVQYNAKGTLTIAVNKEGADGKGISSVVKRYARASSTAADSSGVPTSIDSTTGWITTMPSLSYTWPYLWCKETISYTDGSTPTITYYVMAKIGEQGTTGRMYYMAGKFNDPMPASGYYELTDQLCPVVYYKLSDGTDSWWYLKAGTAYSTDVPNIDDQTVWGRVQDYAVVLTEAIFVKEFAQFGSAIITGDWLISVHGTIDGSAEAGSVEEPAYYPSGSSNPTYVYFDSVRPTASEVLVSSDVSLSSSYTNITGKFSCDAARTNIFVVGGSSCDAYVYLYDYTSNTMAGSVYRVQSGSTVAIRVNLSSKGHEYYIKAYGSGTISYISVVPFIPNYAVDLKTGASYQQNAYIKGEIHATSGTFTGKVEADSGYFKGSFYTPALEITSSNFSTYHVQAESVETWETYKLLIATSGLSLIYQLNAVYTIQLPRDTSNYEGAEIRIVNASNYVMRVFGLAVRASEAASGSFVEWETTYVTLYSADVIVARCIYLNSTCKWVLMSRQQNYKGGF